MGGMPVATGARGAVAHPTGRRVSAVATSPFHRERGPALDQPMSRTRTDTEEMTRPASETRIAKETFSPGGNGAPAESEEENRGLTRVVKRLSGFAWNLRRSVVLPTSPNW